MSRSGRFEGTCTTALDKALRIEFPEASFYNQIEERRVGQTWISNFAVSLETIDSCSSTVSEERGTHGKVAWDYRMRNRGG